MTETTSILFKQKSRNWYRVILWNPNTRYSARPRGGLEQEPANLFRATPLSFNSWKLCRAYFSPLCVWFHTMYHIRFFCYHMFMNKHGYIMVPEFMDPQFTYILEIGKQLWLPVLQMRKRKFDLCWVSLYFEPCKQWWWDQMCHLFSNRCWVPRML